MLRQLSVLKQCKCLSVQYNVLDLGLIKEMGTKWNLNGLFFLTSYTSSSYPALECALTLLFPFYCHSFMGLRGVFFLCWHSKCKTQILSEELWSAHPQITKNQPTSAVFRHKRSVWCEDRRFWLWFCIEFQLSETISNTTISRESLAFYCKTFRTLFVCFI